ncbi:hypothetical protein D3C72_1619650 [compost metagenome]
MDMVYGFVMMLKCMRIFLQAGVKTDDQAQHKGQKCMEHFFEHTIAVQNYIIH